MMAEQIIGHIRGDKVDGDCLVLSVGHRHALYESNADMFLVYNFYCHVYDTGIFIIR